MPFKSEAQRRLFWAKVNQGEISRSTAKEWEAETPNKPLPQHVKQKEGSDPVEAFLLAKAAAEQKRKDYGPSGKWIYDRAHEIMKGTKDQYGKAQGESIAYAIATQQAHKVGKSPKGFRTAEGVATAKEKYQGPKSEYKKTASDQVKEALMRGLLDELTKIAVAKWRLLARAPGAAGRAAAQQLETSLGLVARQGPMGRAMSIPMRAQAPVPVAQRSARQMQQAVRGVTPMRETPTIDLMRNQFGGQVPRGLPRQRSQAEIHSALQELRARRARRLAGGPGAPWAPATPRPDPTALGESAFETQARQAVNMAKARAVPAPVTTAPAPVVSAGPAPAPVVTATPAQAAAPVPVVTQAPAPISAPTVAAPVPAPTAAPVPAPVAATPAAPVPAEAVAPVPTPPSAPGTMPSYLLPLLGAGGLGLGLGAMGGSMAAQ